MAWTIHNIHDAVFGADARKEVGNILKGYGCKGIALIYDTALEPLGFVEELQGIINASGIGVVLHPAACSEPTESSVSAFVKLCRDSGIDGIAALGGGSAMDTAKLAGKVLANGGSVQDYLGGYTALSLGEKVYEPIVAIPTTAGTGSESCWGIMCLNEQTDIKTYARHPVTRAVVDPIYCRDLPPYVTAYTGMDALAQCAECLVNTHAMPNLMADMLSREGLSLALKYLPIAVHEPHDMHAREMMCWSAMLSGYAITLRKTSAGHAIANQISDTFHLPHGVGVSCGMAALARYNVYGGQESTKAWAPLFGLACPEGADLVQVGQRLVEKLDAFQKGIGLKSMKALGIPESFCDIAAENIAHDAKWKIVPNPPDFEHLRKSLHDSWDY